MDLSIKAGSTSQSINIFIGNSSVTTGAGLTGIAFNTAGLAASFSFTGANAGRTAITLATLAAVNSAWASGGFKEIDGTNMPGWYRMDLPDAVLATSKGRQVSVQLKGVTDMRQTNINIELTATDNQATMESQVLGVDMTEAYPTVGNPVTARKALYAIHQYLFERGISGTTQTIKKRDQSTAAKTITIDSATTPTSSTEAT